MAPAFENYTFEEKDGAMEVLVDMDAEDEYAEMFSETAATHPAASRRGIRGVAA